MKTRECSHIHTRTQLTHNQQTTINNTHTHERSHTQTHVPTRERAHIHTHSHTTNKRQSIIAQQIHIHYTKRYEHDTLAFFVH